jgi:putative transposase
VARVHERIKNVRDNFLHQLSTRLVRRFGRIVLEDLSVKGLARGRLAKSFADAAAGEFRRQVEYKAEAAGTEVVFADRFFPSSKTCNRCGKAQTLTLKDRVLWCPCGEIVSRDHNAAFNLENYPGTPGKSRAGRVPARAASMNRERTRK